MTTNAAAEKIYSYGFVPTTFPRDPVEVNQFNEHIILGQIIEPIIDTDKLGNLMPGIATSWEFLDGGRKVVLHLRQDRVFSNGKPIAAADVKYTLDRAIEKKSQSSNFLKNISEIQAPKADTLIILMKDVDVSILKALSRDQLGVVPLGWQFDKSSNEPIIGSGAYRLVRENNTWLLVANGKYPNVAKIEIPKWKLQFYADDKMTIPDSDVPDYAPGLGPYARKTLMENKAASSLEGTEQLSFAQSSAWWHPSGDHFEDPKAKAFAMGLVESVFATGIGKLGYGRATGVIPKGVAGHIDIGTAAAHVTLKNPGIHKIKIVVIGAVFDEVLGLELFQKLGTELGVHVEVEKISPTQLANLKTIKPDIILACWAGGFNDPEGFIALLPTLLGRDLKEYIGPKLTEIYTRAQREQNWTNRSDLFREINARLRSEQFMVPGWKDPLFVMAKHELVSSEITQRYTPRLEAVKIRGN